MNAWAAILAGGAGTRFWPLSTPERPKQLLPLAGDRPLLLQAVERLDGLVPAERILILTGPLLVDQVARVVPQIPQAQIFAEPRRPPPRRHSRGPLTGSRSETPEPKCCRCTPTGP